MWNYNSGDVHVQHLRNNFLHTLTHAWLFISHQMNSGKHTAVLCTKQRPALFARAFSCLRIRATWRSDLCPSEVPLSKRTQLLPGTVSGLVTCRTRAVKLTWKKYGVTSASSARNYKETEIWNICYNTSCCFYVDVSTKIKTQIHFFWSTDQQANVQGGLLITCIYVLKVVRVPSEEIASHPNWLMLIGHVKVFLSA